MRLMAQLRSLPPRAMAQAQQPLRWLLLRLLRLPMCMCQEVRQRLQLLLLLAMAMAMPQQVILLLPLDRIDRRMFSQVTPFPTVYLCLRVHLRRCMPSWRCCQLISLRHQAQVVLTLVPQLQLWVMLLSALLTVGTSPARPSQQQPLAGRQQVRSSSPRWLGCRRLQRSMRTQPVLGWQTVCEVSWHWRATGFHWTYHRRGCLHRLLQCLPLARRAARLPFLWLALPVLRQVVLQLLPPPLILAGCHAQRQPPHCVPASLRQWTSCWQHCGRRAATTTCQRLCSGDGGSGAL